MNTVVTIITQAYNASKYIHKCIRSVINQTYPNIEYLIIDDGSTDDTPDIIKEYAEKDSRIKCVLCEDNSRNVARWIDILQDGINVKNVNRGGTVCCLILMIGLSLTVLKAW